jgi:hypothetical protein
MDEPFTTDRCSVVADLDQSACCISHDWAYWKGGSEEDRSRADREFFNCIWKTSRFPILAPIRWLGVRIGGKKFWRAPRVAWNYGWNDFEWRDEDGPITEASQRPVLIAALKQAGEDADSTAANA